ncbi:MAG TPA: cytidine deaminase [Polyangiaceae bacterium]|nr:cytidine deaminase [Polyangiaceae bacterium]
MRSTVADEYSALIDEARRVRDNAYAPYSGFKVGAAVRGKSGAIYRGCNVENASYGATICAERNAVAALVAAGESEIAAIAIYTDDPQLTMPCGICRQVIVEFGKDAQVITANTSASKQIAIGDLLPDAFVFLRS